MAKFIYKEFLKTNTGIDNIPNKGEEDNINKLMQFLNEVLADYSDPVIVTSGFRSEGVNKAVGGVATSHHRLGLATDLTTKDVVKLRDHLKKHIDQCDQIIYYVKKNFVHISIHTHNRKQYFEK